jgi:hypothetical protein
VKVHTRSERVVRELKRVEESEGAWKRVEES